MIRPSISGWRSSSVRPRRPGGGKEFLSASTFGRRGAIPKVNDKVSPAQIAAMDKWGVQQEGSYGYLKTIKQPHSS